MAPEQRQRLRWSIVSMLCGMSSMSALVWSHPGEVVLLVTYVVLMLVGVPVLMSQIRRLRRGR